MGKMVSPKFPLEESADDSFSREERELLALVGERLDITEEQKLVSGSQESSHFYYLLSGKATVEYEGKIQEEISVQGSPFGEEALLGLPAVTSVSVSKGSRVVRMDTRDLLPLIYHSHPSAVKLAEQVGESMMKRLKSLEGDVFRGKFELSKEQVTSFVEHKAKLEAKWSLLYHSLGVQGKVSIKETKPLGTSEALSVAYSPGVAQPCLVIKADPDKAYDYTSKGHLVGVVSNG